MKCRPLSSRVVVGLGANNPTPEKITVKKPPEPVEEDHGGCQDPHKVIAPVKEKKKLTNIVTCMDRDYRWVLD
jgi:hypothetical protein